MKHLLLFLLLAVAPFAYAATDTPTNTPTNTPTRTVTPFVVPSYTGELAEVYVSPLLFNAADGATQMTTVVSAVGLTGTSVRLDCAPCALMAAAVSISFTTVIRVPSDFNPDQPNNGQVYAIVSQSTANDLGLKGTFTQSNQPNGVSWTASALTSRTGIEATVNGTKALALPQFVELSSRTITAGAQLRFYPGRTVALTVQRSTGTTGAAYIHGLVFRYNKRVK